ncbi:MAG TPA: peptidylprolyl isomerase [Chitinophagales bacterium]|nr:peptidylprolyl isomerase [Chitinophagales bacterium]
MKKPFAIFSLAIYSLSLFAQASTDNRVLFTAGGDKVTVSEFQYVYNKNNVNNQADYSEKSLRDYLALYENFRLKVKEAEALKLDTISSLKTELEGYRKQLAKSYLTDREISDKLITEAYDRSKIEVNASHILVRLDENANPADTLAAYKKIMALKKRIDKGEAFEKVAKENSEDPSAKTNEGNLGYFTVFGTIYPFENAAFSLKPGEMSPAPVRTEFGYHLVKVKDVRAARGQIHAAHLLLRFPEKATQEQKDSLKKKIDGIYAQISSGKITFDDAVKEFSDDKATRIKGGELQWFGSGTSIRMVPEFEDAAFALAKDGDYTKPVMTQFGWHIIKRLERRDIAAFADAKADIKKRVERDSRSQVAKSVLIDRIKKENGFAQFPEVKTAFFTKLDSTIFKGNWKADSVLRAMNKPLFVLAGKNYTTTDFADYIEKNSKKRTDKAKDALLNEYYEGFVNTKALEYEESTLETKKPDFKNLMKEYKDGILLFELMDRQVWTKAVKDTVGLEAFRKQNEQKYLWGDRAEAVIFNCNDKKICDDAYKIAAKKPVDEIKAKLNKDGAKARVSVIEGKYEKGQYEVVDKTEWKVGATPVNKLNDSSYQFVLIKQIVKPEPKSLKEAKGYIVSDYQEYLEKTWLADLRNKYPITVDEAVLKSLIKK